ncbi:hypothetical protein ARHIZOSPH14_02150 [Agromyces rhizosphaerae]|uniref:DUF4192 family protein n=1 Tax=Agromyces rhizosphaerae TaxID=88374 RepID=A0A9W6CY42_9MICO|nr:DUF4192 domain-containing protein [Agromyces rhizosphaerae]GLI25973.1 hypothetical protein ARHIZOSPH14_02150 [Agromyces rhizosphaerae]
MTAPDFRIRQPQDLIAVAAELVGFRPERSVVCVAVRHDRRSAAIRCDLPPDPRRRDGELAVTRALDAMLQRVGAVEAVVVIVYPPETFAAERGIPRPTLGRSVHSALARAGHPVVDVLCVAGDGWGSYLDDGCPREGRPLEEVEASPLAARQTVRSAATPDSLAALPRVDAGFARAVRDACDAVFDRLRHPRGAAFGPAGTSGDAREVPDPVELVEELVGWEPGRADAARLGRLLAVLQVPSHRDVVLLQVAFGRDVGLVAAEREEVYALRRLVTGRAMDDLVAEDLARGPHADDVVLQDLLMGCGGRTPDVRRIDAAIEVLRLLVACAEPEDRVDPLCILAWLSWARGRGSIAAAYLDRAGEIDPGHGMADVLRAIIGAGRVPEWSYLEPDDEPVPAT